LFWFCKFIQAFDIVDTSMSERSYQCSLYLIHFAQHQALINI